MPPSGARSHTGFQLQLSPLALEITQADGDKETGPEEPSSVPPATCSEEWKQAIPLARARERAVKSELIGKQRTSTRMN